MQEKAKLAKIRLDEIKRLMKRGDISYDLAKCQAKEPLKILNSYMTKRAVDFGVSPRLVHFTGFMR